MKVLAISHPCIADVNQQFYAELEALGHEVELIVPSNFRTEYSPEMIRVSRWPAFQGHIEQREVGFSSSIPLHFYRSNLRKIINKYRPDVLYVEEEPYSLSAWQAFYASRHLKIKRIVYSAQNILKHYPAPFRWMEQYVLSHADIAAVVSKEVGRVLETKGYRGNVLSLPLGVDTNQFRPCPQDGIKIRRQLGLNDEFVVGYIGRFVKEKGILNIIETLPHFRNTKVKFLFIGNGPLLKELNEAKMSFPNGVIIAGPINHRDVHCWMNAMNVLLLPSLTQPNWKEQFGRVIIEAMACGVPVIGSDSGEIPRLIRETGGGWSFPEGDIAQIVQAIYVALNNEHERSLKVYRGMHSVQLKYSKKSIADSFSRAIANR